LSERGTVRAIRSPQHSGPGDGDRPDGAQRWGAFVSTIPQPVTEEPVRGVVGPPWLASLPGIERMRLYARRVLPATPIARLTGFGIGHVSSGTLTGTLKASGHLVMAPAYNLSALSTQALYTCALTAVDAGMDLDPIVNSIQYFRPPRPQPGNFLARARVLNSSSYFVSCTAEIEDPVGRLVGFAASQWGVRQLEPPPPSAPASIEPAHDAVYPTPDPPDRPPVGGLVPAELQARYGGLELCRMIMASELPPLPLMHTCGARWVSVDEGLCQVLMPASEWFCSMSRTVESAAIESLLNIASTLATLTLSKPGESFAGLELTTRFLRRVPADGRDLFSRGRVAHRSGNLITADAEAIDADGQTIAAQTVTYAVLDPRKRQPVEPERVLATLLFTDIVGSTPHAERMGDAAWRSLLAEHEALVRRELGIYRGREVKTIGDGFLARFDSPASAIRAARGIRDGVKRLHLEVRGGIHTGECEVHGTDLAGIAVHVAARIVALAGPSEILVSHTVRDLAAGSGIHFAARGQHKLKGVDDEFGLFAVED
jgi:class 3 adenylate cyclase